MSSETGGPLLSTSTAPPLALHAEVFAFFVLCLSEFGKKSKPESVDALAESALSFSPPRIPPFDSHGNMPVQVSSSGPICKLGKVS